MRTPTAEQRLGAVLEKRYPDTHDLAADRALWQYTQDLKNQFSRNAPSLSEVMYDSKIYVLKNALGLHAAVSRVQGDKPKAKAEIRVATVFRSTPGPFLRMTAARELAHLKEKGHDKAFCQLYYHMEPQYRQLEFDTRLRLTQQPLKQIIQSRADFVFRAC